MIERDMKVEKITLLVSSPLDTLAFDTIITRIQEGEMMGEYKLIHYKNPTEYKLEEASTK
jgi:hypothetical protein